VAEEEGRLAYRVRTAEAADAAALRQAIGATLAHPDHQGQRESYRGAAARGDILVLERFDRPSHTWQMAGFVECHMRVDDNLSIRDIGTHGDEPQTGVVRYLLDQAFNSFRPAAAQVKIRRDATAWLEIFRAIPGFYLEGEEYRRPHYWTIWRWDRQHLAEAQAPPRQAPAQRRPPRPPTPPRGPAAAPAGRQARGPVGNPQARPNRGQPGAPPPRSSRGQPGGPPPRPGARPPGPPGGRPPAPRPARPPRRAPRPANPR